MGCVSSTDKKSLHMPQNGDKSKKISGDSEVRKIADESPRERRLGKKAMMRRELLDLSRPGYHQNTKVGMLTRMSGRGEEGYNVEAPPFF